MDAAEFLKKLDNNEETKVEFHKQLYTKQIQTQERLKMIESVYSIKPSDILARVALEKAEGTLEKEDDQAQPMGVRSPVNNAAQSFKQWNASFSPV